MVSTRTSSTRWALPLSMRWRSWPLWPRWAPPFFVPCSSEVFCLKGFWAEGIEEPKGPFFRLAFAIAQLQLQAANLFLQLIDTALFLEAAGAMIHTHAESYGSSTRVSNSRGGSHNAVPNLGAVGARSTRGPCWLIV
jgi:hypothetical protein